MNHNNHQENHQHSHQDHHRMMIRDFKRRFWVTLGLTIPILLLSPLIQSWLGIDWDYWWEKYVLFGLSTVVFFYGGFPFLKGLVDELKDKQPGMMTLIAVAIIVAYSYSSAVVFGLDGKTFFWELATLILVMLLGHWIEMRPVLGASRALEELMALMPDEAHLIQENGEIKEVSVDELKKGDRIQIKPREKIPADGEIIEGESSLNESMLTGESKPVSKQAGDQVIGGAINGSGSLQVEVKHTGEDAYLNKVVKMVQEAQEKKSKTQRLADTADIVLVESNPKDISQLILFGQATYRKMVQNLFWATAYNVVAIPLAAGALYNIGIMISPALGAGLMSLSTVIVALNAQLLRGQLK